MIRRQSEARPVGDSDTRPIQVGDVVRCYALPQRRKRFRHATVKQIRERRGALQLRVRFDIWKETWVPATECERIERLKFRWRHGRKVPP